jgi:hypothetical protein
MPNRESRKTGGRPSLDELLTLVDEEVALLHNDLGGLPRAVEADEILRAIWIDDVHNSTAIEGNTMTRAQVENLVDRGRVNAELSEALDVEGYARAADWVYRHAGDYRGVPLEVLSEIHKQAMALVWEVEPPPTHDRPGSWRKGGVRVRGVQVSLPAAVPADLRAWTASTRRSAGQHPIVHAAVHHARLEKIHPLPETSSIISGTPHGVDPRRGLHASTPTAQHAGSYTDSTLHEGRNSAYVAPIGTKSKGKDTRGRSLGIAPIRSASYPVGVSIKAPADRRRQMFVDSC